MRIGRGIGPNDAFLRRGHSNQSRREGRVLALGRLIRSRGPSWQKSPLGWEFVQGGKGAAAICNRLAAPKSRKGRSILRGGRKGGRKWDCAPQSPQTEGRSESDGAISEKVES